MIMWMWTNLHRDIIPAGTSFHQSYYQTQTQLETHLHLQVFLQNKQLLMFLNNKCFGEWHQSKMQHKSDCATVLGACLTASDTFWASLLADVTSLIRSGSLNPEWTKKRQDYYFMSVAIILFCFLLSFLSPKLKKINLNYISEISTSKLSVK